MPYLQAHNRQKKSRPPRFETVEIRETVIELAMRCEGWSMLVLFADLSLGEGDIAEAELLGKTCVKLAKGCDEDKELLTCLLRFTVNYMSFDMPCWRAVRGAVLHQVIKLGRNTDLENFLELGINSNTSVVVDEDKERTLFQLALLLNKPESLELLLEYGASSQLDWLTACETVDFWKEQGCVDGLSRMDCLMRFVGYVNANSESLEERLINFCSRSASR